MFKHSIVCICLFALLVVINARTIDEAKHEIQELDKQLIEKLNKLDTLEKEKSAALEESIEQSLKKESKEFEHLLEDIESQAEKRVKRQTPYAYQPTPVAAAAPAAYAPAPVAAAPAAYAPTPVAAAPAATPYGGASNQFIDNSASQIDASQQQQQQSIDTSARSTLDLQSIMSNPQMMQFLQSQFPAQFPQQQTVAALPRATLGQVMPTMPAMPTTPIANPAAMGTNPSRLGMGLLPFEKLRMAPFAAIRKLSFNGADPTTMTLNANGNPLPNSCARGVSEPIWEGFQITESYCRCPGDDSYGFTCAEGFGNPCAATDAQFFSADARIPNNYFVHCSNYIPYLKKCPAGLVWDQSLTTCNWPATQPAVGAAPYGQAAAPIATPYAAPAPAAAPSYAAPAPAATPSYSAPAAPVAAAPAYSAPAAPAAAPAAAYGSSGYMG